VTADKSNLLTQNVLQRRMQKDVTELKTQMRKQLQAERQKHRRELHSVKVRYPTHTTNVHHSTFIHPSADLIFSDSLPKFTSL
jgi:hypothetical protein